MSGIKMSSELLVCFAAVLIAAILLSGVSRRTVLSASVLFLAAGFTCGPQVLNVATSAPSNAFFRVAIEIALFAVLFNDGLHTDLDSIKSAWRLPGRALMFGLPLTLILIAMAGHWIIGLNWIDAALLGAVISPTDPLFAQALVQNEKVPLRLRKLLNIESGFNDGLALPFVIVLLELKDSGPKVAVFPVVLEVVLGVLLGIAAPWTVLLLTKIPLFQVRSSFQGLLGFAIALLVFAAAPLAHANEFVAAFVAGGTVATLSKPIKSGFQELGETLSRLLKVTVIFGFGLGLSTDLFASLGAGEYAFVAVTLLAVRPIALLFSLCGAELPRSEFAVAAWFGPRGFASIYYHCWC